MTHPETIICPECGSIQEATVQHGNPFNTYIHECSVCGHIIMESDWVECDGGDDGQSWSGGIAGNH